jgi:hypothetical protein
MTEMMPIETAELPWSPVEGQAVALWRYPVASLRGEEMPALDFAASGVVGDRSYGILDASKNVLVGSSRPGWDALITWSARYLGPVTMGASLPPVEIRFPDGGSQRSDDPDCDRLLSERLGKPIRLILNDGSIVEPRYALAPCHFLTTATLAKLAEIYPEGRFDPVRFRPNLVLDCGAANGFIEQGWLGKRLVGAAVELTVTEDCVRCALTVRAQGDLPKDPRILHTVTQHNRTLCGGYAAVTMPGHLDLGMTLTVDR